MITSCGQATGTSLSNVFNGETSHDSIIRALVDRKLTSKDYWKIVKPTIREIQDEKASLSIDDLIVDNPHSEEFGVVAYFLTTQQHLSGSGRYFDYTQGRTVKGINIVDAAHIAAKAQIPLDVVVAKKLEYKVDLQGKLCRPQAKTKHGILDDILRFAVQNEVPFKTV